MPCIEGRRSMLCIGEQALLHRGRSEQWTAIAGYGRDRGNSHACTKEVNGKRNYINSYI